MTSRMPPKGRSGTSRIFRTVSSRPVKNSALTMLTSSMISTCACSKACWLELSCNSLSGMILIIQVLSGDYIIINFLNPVFRFGNTPALSFLPPLPASMYLKAVCFLHTLHKLKNNNNSNNNMYMYMLDSHILHHGDPNPTLSKESLVRFPNPICRTLYTQTICI